MKKSIVRWWVLLAVLLLVYHVIAFAVPFQKTTVFWISYVFTMIAILAQIYVIRTAFPAGGSIRSKFYGFPIAKFGVVYMAVQAVGSIIFMKLGASVKTWIPLVLYVLLLGLAVVGFIAADVTREEIERQDVKLKKDVSTMRALQSKAASMVGMMKGAGAAEELSAFAEELRFSDPVSSDSLQAVEADLASCIDEIQKAIVEEDFSAVTTLSQKARTILAERNRLCKLNKSRQ